LKNRILAQIPDLQSHKEGRDVFLAFDKDIALVLQQASKSSNCYDEAIILAKAAQIIRRDIEKSKLPEFNGTFDESCQQNCLPQSLIRMVSMILSGSNHSSTIDENQAALSCSQLLFFNSASKNHSTKAKNMYHKRDKEPPLPVYLGLLWHAETRKRSIIDKLYNLGLSVSYETVLTISTDIANAVSSRFEEEKVVCPPTLCKDLFTTGAVDNIDHNPSSTTAQDSFHGTGISLFQHTTSSVGVPRDAVCICGEQRERKKSITPLPDDYASVKPLTLLEKEPKISGCDVTTIEMTPQFEQDRTM
jgi:hypothetical protein